MRTIFEGQEVSAAIDVKVKGNRFVAIDASSMLKKPENCSIPARTAGVVERIEDTRILVKFYPDTNSMVALWFQRISIATFLKLKDAVYRRT